MTTRAGTLWARLSLARQYMLASFVILVCCMAGVGWWVNNQIEAGVIRETAATTALYINSFVAPLLQDLATEDELRPAQIKSLDGLVHETPLGRQITSFKVWNREGRILYSTNHSLIGSVYPMNPDSDRAWNGQVASSISNLDSPEHSNERLHFDRLLETYSPVRLSDGSEIIAVAEFYQTVDDLESLLSESRAWTWIVVGGTTLAMYILLAGIVQRGSDTIRRQQVDLLDSVEQLRGLLDQNEVLNKRVRRAATGGTERNERFLKRISAELHDGPAQALSFALLRLDSVVTAYAECDCREEIRKRADSDLRVIHASLRDALEEIRSFSSGLVLPELDDLSLQETFSRVKHFHQRRTGSGVDLYLGDLPAQASLPLKITAYRFVQEALANAYRHASGRGQTVRVTRRGDMLCIEVSDCGEGFDARGEPMDEGRLGLEGMRQRVESIGGTFHLRTAPGRGTHVHAHLPLDPVSVRYAQ